MRIWLFLAGLNGAVGVAMAALAAHAFVGDATAAGLIEKASRLQLMHALALFGVALLRRHRPSRAVTVAGALFTLGIVLFCGSVYALAYKAAASAPLAPVGGLAFILGWLVLAVSAFASGGGDER